MAQLDRIRDVLHRRPFVPFAIKMVDGTVCSVRGRDWLSVPPIRRPREVAFYSVPEGGADDEFRTHWLSLALVSEVIVSGVADAAASPEAAGADEGDGD